MKIISATFAKAALEKLDSHLLDQHKRIRLLPAAYYREHFTQDEISAWCVQRARYCLPTIELIAWLKEQIADRTAIEIGSGNGDLSHHLGIQGTDSYIQSSNGSYQTYYTAANQARTKPTSDIARLEAFAAVKRYKPAVVIGAWITQRWQPGDINGSDWGVDEEKLLKNTYTYIHIGNLAVHGDKRILKRLHTCYQPDWLISRAQKPAGNIIYMWNRA